MIEVSDLVKRLTESKCEIIGRHLVRGRKLFFESFSNIREVSVAENRAYLKRVRK